MTQDISQSIAQSQPKGIADAMNAPKQIVQDQTGEPIGIAPARN
jgi:hypothetical protein